MRHGVTQTLKSIALASDDLIDRADVRVANTTFKGLHPVKTKDPDEPLGAILASKGKLSPKKATTENSKARMSRYRLRKLRKLET
jgi:hypothetical protein